MSQEFDLVNYRQSCICYGTKYGSHAREQGADVKFGLFAIKIVTFPIFLTWINFISCWSAFAVFLLSLRTAEIVHIHIS